jgi:gliding motility-associated-like protein
MYGPHDVELTVVNDHGCKSVISHQIFVDIKANIQMPNTFAPTNPAYGVRYFQPVAHGLIKCEVWVFDKWGNLLWYSDEVENGIFVGKWDGTYNGEMLQSDTYIWKMEATFADGKQWAGSTKSNGVETKYGTVLLLR